MGYVKENKKRRRKIHVFPSPFQKPYLTKILEIYVNKKGLNYT